MNQVALIGNLTRDPELKSLPRGKDCSVLEFTLAYDERYKDPETGEWGESPNFFDVDVYGPYGERVAPYLTKGMRVGVEARLVQRSWEAEDGSKRSKVSLVAFHVDFLSSAADNPAETETPDHGPVG
ncbi:MAG: single-stranded DNA-binding protein [Coriobacteriia bacterium]|nr:single-stranded DNA-binding protein [Coriobacteriia bacterium]